jgi:3-dehydroquinate dehydratase/shikimate dehydrogenase
MQSIASLVSEATGTGAGPLEAIAHPPAGASVVELRLDHFPQLDPAAAVAACPLPVLLTLRSRAEGGAGPDSAIEREPLLRCAHEAGAALIDLEHDRDLGLMDSLGITPERVIVSWHDPKGTPGDLERIAERLLATRARWVKLIPSAQSLTDLGAVLALNRRFNHQPSSQRRLIAFAMGPVGIPSRFLAPLLGPPLAYAAWSRGAAAAPGQLTSDELEAVIGHLSGPPQRLFGVVGADTSQSLSPRMHSAAFRSLDLKDLFIPVSVGDPRELDCIFSARGKGLFDSLGLPAHGWAVTTPYKANAAAAATRLSPRVRLAKAANTLIPVEGGLLADSTDADGAVGAVQQLGLDPLGSLVVVQGTGGAGRAAAIGLHNAGAAVLLRGRDDSRARAIAEEMGLGHCPSTTLPAGPAILVNATPLGSAQDDESPFDEATIGRASGVVDMVYGTHPTRLAVLARSMGVPLADGRDFLAHQGYSQLAAFTRKVPPRDVMRAAID